MTEQTPAEVLEEIQEAEVQTETIEGTETETQTEEAQETPEPPQEESEEAKEIARKAYEARQQKKNALKQENEHLRKQLEAIQRQTVQAQPQAQPPIQQNRDPRIAPEMDQFDTVEEYLNARDQHRDFVRDVQSREMQIQKSFDDQMAQYSAKHQDFLDQVESSQVVLQPHLVRAVKESANAPKVLHELVKDEALAYRLNSLDPMSLMREVIALESKAESKEPAISSAPKPIKTPSGSSVTPAKTLENLPRAEFNKAMEEAYKNAR